MKFLIQSKTLDKLSPEIKIAVDMIKEAIKTKTPILIRHHADADGYCGAIALERAILPLIYDAHKRERDIQYYYTRLPEKAPYYDYKDASKDLAIALQNMTRYGYKPPLIILVDNGSSIQDLPGIQKAKLYNAKIIVIDHHPNDIIIDENVDIHINPHIVGSDYDFCAGMMCAEIAKQLNKEVEDMEYIAAVAGIADKVESSELKEYIKLSETDIEHLTDVAQCLDFEAYATVFMENREVINDLLGQNPTKQKQLVKLIKGIIEKRINEQMLSNKKYAEIKEKKIIIAKLNIQKTRMFGEFPLRGKTAGILHDFLKEKHKKPVITIGYGSDFVCFRCSKDLKDFDMNEILALIKKKLPYAQADGGGHAKAGSINFIESAKDDVMKIVDEYIKRW